MLIASYHGLGSYIVGFLVHFGLAYFLGIFRLCMKISVKLKSPECEVLSGDFGYTLGGGEVSSSFIPMQFSESGACEPPL